MVGMWALLGTGSGWLALVVKEVSVLQTGLQHCAGGVGSFVGPFDPVNS